MTRLLLTACVLTLTACSHAKTKPEPVRVGCVNEPPPVTEALPFLPCPDGLTVCLDLDGAKVLQRNVRDMKNWIDSVWIRCGPTQG
jgi:hypothetical protein